MAIAQCVSITCPADITVSNDPGVCGATVTYSTPVGQNSCGSPASQTFNYTSAALQTFTVPAGVDSIHIVATGAQGGSVTTTCAATGGLGAKMEGDFVVTPGEVISIMVGQQGYTNGSDAGGGGGTFVVRTGNVLLIAAGGGGGATNNIGSCGSNRDGSNASITTSGLSSGDGLVAGGINGNGGGASSGSGGGGGGFLTDGTAGSGLANNNGKAYVNGGAGGTGNNTDSGGYGGGGAGWFTGGNGGGGGGYSGGGTSGSQPYTGGGGGGSYNAGTNQVNVAGFQTGNGQVIISYNDGPATTTMLQGLASGSVFPIGVTTVEYQVSDGGTDVQSCSFTVTVNDTEAPTMTCPANITVNTDPGQCTAVVSFSDPVPADNCGVATSSWTSGLASGSAFPIGQTVNEYTVVDINGNTGFCQTTVEVIDAEGPIGCPSNTDYCDSVLVGYGSSFTDCSGVSTIAYTLSGVTTGSGSGDGAGVPLNVGVTTVSYDLTDGLGNSSTCSFDITVLTPTIVTGSSSQDTTCANYAPAQLTGTPSGGTWSGTGVTGTTFDPSVSGVGSFELVYSFTETNGCIYTDTITQVVQGCANLLELDGDQVNVLPNPSSGIFHVKATEGLTIESFFVMDVNGKVIISKEEGLNNETTVDLSWYENGIYILTIQTSKGKISKKLIKN